MSKTPTILAATALVVAVFGSTPLGNAAGRMILPKNSVGSAQLKTAAVTGAKVKDGTLVAADFAPGQLSGGQQGPKGDPGAQGPKGDTGLRGPTGAPGLSGYEVVTGPIVSVTGPAGFSTATCPAGKLAVGGGYVAGGGTGGIVAASAPTAAGTAWTVGLRNAGGVGTPQVEAFAVCAAVAP
jgi:hypothetical protein